MRRKTARLLLSGGVLAAVLSGGAAALSGGDGLVSLRDLNEVFLPKAQTQMEERMDSALQSTYDQALAQVQGESGGGGGLYSADLRSRTFRQGDVLTLPTGSGVLALAGTGEVIHSGAFIDVTEGAEVPSGSRLTPGHRYLTGEDTSAVLSVRSGAMYLGLQGSYGYEPGGGDPLPFVDVAQGDWFQAAVEYVYRNGLFSGMSADRFSPGTTMNRAMLVTVFYRLAGSPEGELNAADASFTDVADGSWYAPFVRWGYVQGVTAGMGDGSFAPEQSVTRQQILVMLHSFARQYLKLTPTGTADLSIYGDGGQVAGWARDAVSWAVSAGLIVPSGEGTLRPADPASRAEVAAILMKFSSLYL